MSEEEQSVAVRARFGDVETRPNQWYQIRVEDVVDQFGQDFSPLPKIAQSHPARCCRFVGFKPVNV